jgi:HD superfamily phosphohydrolase
MANLVYRKNTLFNDPIYGFIAIETDLILNLINHPFFQRLRRISQMGLSSMVYPGAHHTRFEHAIGAMHIMQKAIEVLSGKGVKISAEEKEGMQIAILLHDIGHGPFSHATEETFLKGVNHEKISLRVMTKLNQHFKGQLDLALEIFTGKYPRKFMHQLVSGQVDVDRLDYLKRDSFYTGVTEGNINTDRIVAMMNVKDEELVFEVKAVHSLEKFLLARRLMYWQVYLHKTSLVAELLLVKALERFQLLYNKKTESLEANHMLYPFLTNSTSGELSEAILDHYLTLDDSDLLQVLKSWRNHSDETLRTLSDQLINRRLPKIIIQEKEFTEEEVERQKNRLEQRFKANQADSDFVFSGSISNQTYVSDESQILLLKKNESVFPISEAIQYLDFKQFSTPVVKHFLCFPKRDNSL